jgi:RNA polymerase sigma-70 factor, ECF subfamily
MAHAPESEPAPQTRRSRAEREGAADGAAVPGDSSTRVRHGDSAAHEPPSARAESACSGAQVPPSPRSLSGERRDDVDEAPALSGRRLAIAARREEGAAVKKGLTREAAYVAEAPVRELLRQGDRRTAIGWLMDAYGEELYGYCYRLTRKNEALAKDALQDAYVRAYRNLGQVRPETYLRSWLHSIAHHRVVDLLRAQGARPGSISDIGPDELAVEGQGAEASIDLKRAYELLGGFVGELPAEEQDLVALRYGHGLSYEEMAEMRGKKAGTLQARVARALTKLRGRLKKGKVEL